MFKGENNRNDKPILPGKVNKIGDIYTLMGHMGDVHRINVTEYSLNFEHFMKAVYNHRNWFELL